MTAKRCPMCHALSGAGAWRCACGYEFGQDVDKALELLRDQRTNTRIKLGLLVAVDVLATAAAIVLVGLGLHVLPLLGVGALLGATARVARRLSISNASIRQLSQRQLPKATLRKG